MPEPSAARRRLTVILPNTMRQRLQLLAVEWDTTSSSLVEAMLDATLDDDERMAAIGAHARQLNVLHRQYTRGPAKPK